MFAAVLLAAAAGFASCSDDDDDNDGPSNKEYDGTLYGEWIESGGGRYYKDYYYFSSSRPGTGTHGQYDVDLEWAVDEEDITWYTVNDEYLYIDGRKHQYECDGSVLYIDGKRYHENN